MPKMITRRGFIRVGIATAALQIWGRAGAAVSQTGARLRSRPGKPRQRVTPGRQAFGLGGSRDGFLSVPPSYQPGTAIPLILMLHGSHMQSAHFTKFCESAAKDGIAVAVPESRGLTWDGVRGGFGPDIEFLDRVLASVFDRLAVDPRRLAIAGFSDGASYALSVGLSNGDLFSHVIAYSPEYLNAPARYGKPPIYITHGARDPVLSVNSTEGVVRRLQGAGYQVEFKEFSGGHFMPADLVKESFRWFLSKGG